MKALIVIPTYNERGNIRPIVGQIAALGLDIECLFVDDGSPDGTGEEIESVAREFPWVRLLQRGAKLGIGGAHLDALRLAEAENYKTVVTMDCDLTHSPSDIPAMLKEAESADVVVGSRYMQRGSLAGWNWRRKLLTRLAHVLTRVALGIPYDCTGAFRVYRLDRIPKGVFDLVTSRSYPFFFESLFVLAANGARIAQVPIKLPPRTYGSSKMPADEPFRGVRQLLEVACDRLLRPERFRVVAHKIQPDPSLGGCEGWDAYWSNDSARDNRLYQAIATIYRRLVITPRLTRFAKRTFPPGARLLHAGCGSGHVDQVNQTSFRLTGLDASLKALAIYSRSVPKAEGVCHASVFAVPFPDHSFDGAYHLGVIEHFTREEIAAFLGELRRVIKPDGKLLIFWPHARATSVAVLGFWHRHFGKARPPLHPPEISLAEGKAWVREVLAQGGFEMTGYHFGAADFWVQAVVTAKPESA